MRSPTSHRIRKRYQRWHAELDQPCVPAANPWLPLGEDAQRKINHSAYRLLSERWHVIQKHPGMGWSILNRVVDEKLRKNHG